LTQSLKISEISIFCYDKMGDSPLNDSRLRQTNDASPASSPTSSQCSDTSFATGDDLLTNSLDYVESDPLHKALREALLCNAKLQLELERLEAHVRFLEDQPRHSIQSSDPSLCDAGDDRSCSLSEDEDSNWTLVESLNASQELIHPLTADGHFVINLPIPKTLLDFMVFTEDREFTQSRYTAVTCAPDEFPSQGYSLKQQESKRHTEIFIVMTM
jgi:hypothetical protein